MNRDHGQLFRFGYGDGKIYEIKVGAPSGPFPDVWPTPEQSTIEALLSQLQGMDSLKSSLRDSSANEKWLISYTLSRRIPGFADFERYLNSKLQVDLSPASMVEARRQISNKADLSFVEVNSLSLTEAVAILNQQGPEAAAPDTSRNITRTAPASPPLWLPNPLTLTVGQMARLLDAQHKMLATVGDDPARSVPDEFTMRRNVLFACPAYHEFVKWAVFELGRDPDFEAAHALQFRLVKQLQKWPGEIDLMPMTEAMSLLERSKPLEAESNLPPAVDARTKTIERTASPGAVATAPNTAGTVAPEAASPPPPSEKDGARAARGKPLKNPNDPLEETVLKLGRAIRKIDLLRFLAARENRSAELATIAKDLYKKQSPSSKKAIKNTRSQVEDARDKLRDSGCPLQIHISGNVVRLIDADPVA